MKIQENVTISLVIPVKLKDKIVKEAKKDDRKYTAYIRKVLMDKFCKCHQK